MSVEAEDTRRELRAEKPTFLTRKRFTDFDLPVEVLKGLQEVGFTHCTPIQDQTLPLSLAGQDVAGQAQTGTGKTAAFLITIFTRLLALPERKPGYPAALVVAPTRELAQQIYEEASLIGRHTGLKPVQVVGGIDYQKQAQQLRDGVDIVICTPGRIIDYLKQGIFKTDDIKILVIDEADRLFDLGFTRDMRFILKKLPSFQQRQSMLFSATLSYRVLELTYEYMNLPEFISVTPQEVAVEGIEQALFHVGLENKLALLLGILAAEDWSRMLIFVNTKAGVEWLTQKLKGNGWPAEGITGDLPQKKRFQLMEQFKDGQIKILVATDVASRGIHVEDISHVINYDLPQDAENYIHRIGRTARAGKTGKAFSLACELYVYHLEAVEELLGYKIPVMWPDDDWFVKDRCGPVKRTMGARRGKAVQGRGRVRKRLARQKPVEKTWKQTYPGAFFGFLPPDKPLEQLRETEAAEENDPPPASGRKKRRRRPRKKKTVSDNSPVNTVAGPGSRSDSAAQ
jgi:ATP-dependent RNA helicase RhlB